MMDTITECNALISSQEVADLLGVHVRTFNLKKGFLVANKGMVPVKVGGRTKYTAKSVSDMIQTAAKTGEPLW